MRTLVSFLLFLALASARAESNVPVPTSKDPCVLVTARTAPQPGYPVGRATGTGFLVGADLVLTCNHLLYIPMQENLAPAVDVQVHFSDKTVPARVLKRDENHDLALLKLRKPVDAKPYVISGFALKRGAAVTLFGNFPDAVRVSRGKVLDCSVMDGFGMSNAKVRSGFSGGPVLDGAGTVQGIISQRDDDNNSIFVRSDVILSLLDKAGVKIRPESITETTPLQDQEVALPVRLKSNSYTDTSISN